MPGLKILILLLSVSVYIGCGNSADEETSVPRTDTGGAPVNAPLTTPVINTPDTNKTSTLPVPVQVPVVAPATASTRLNPEHGQPGHRCDIAVGAPLDSKPANNPETTKQPAAPTAPTANSGLTITPSAPAEGATLTTAPAKTTAPAITSAKGLNPAHGQPGHRCDIAVGAPLDSKPVTQPVTVTQPGTTVPSDAIKPTPIVTPAEPVKTGTTTTTAPGMNPPHGEPGHRCDIAVGAPLNSKPSPVNKEKEKNN